MSAGLQVLYSIAVNLCMQYKIVDAYINIKQQE